MSDRKLTQEEEEVLTLGPDFAIKKQNLDPFVWNSQIERGISHIQDEIQKNIVRSICVNAMKGDKQQVNKKYKHFKKTITNLKKDKSIVITSADKSNATVIVNKTEYQNQITVYLQQKSLFQMTKHNPGEKIRTEWNHLVKSHHKEKGLSDSLTKKLIAKPVRGHPTMFAQIKIHKEGHPIRPILNGKKHPLQKAEKELARVLNCWIPECNHNLKNSQELLEKLKGMQITNNTRLCSLDVKNMYNSIPRNLVTQAIQWMSDHCTSKTVIKTETLISLVEFLTENSYCKHGQNYYLQIEGLPMGSALSPILANITMTYLEKTKFINLTNRIQAWFRYVDDILVIWKGTSRELEIFFNNLNKCHKQIQFEMEHEDNGSLNFLDITIIKNRTSLETKVYRKESYTGKTIDYRSNHPRQMLKNIATNFFIRAIKSSSKPEYLEEEKEIVKNMLETNNYPKNVIEEAYRKATQITKNPPKQSEKDKIWIGINYRKGVTEKIQKAFQKANVHVAKKPELKIGDILFGKSKHRHSKYSEPGCIYAIMCECKKWYIGETGREFEQRKKEHERYCQTKYELDNNISMKSAIAWHKHSTGHNIEWKNPVVIEREPDKNIRKTKEALYIKYCQPALNLNEGKKVSPQWYHALIPHINIQAATKIKG